MAERKLYTIYVWFGKGKAAWNEVVLDTTDRKEAARVADLLQRAGLNTATGWTDIGETKASRAAKKKPAKKAKKRAKSGKKQTARK